MNVVIFSYPPAAFIRLSVRGRVEPRAIVWPEELRQWRTPNGYWICDLSACIIVPQQTGQSCGPVAGEDKWNYLVWIFSECRIGYFVTNLGSTLSVRSSTCFLMNFLQTRNAEQSLSNFSFWVYCLQHEVWWTEMCRSSRCVWSDIYISYARWNKYQIFIVPKQFSVKHGERRGERNDNKVEE
jgi:hypothetical protein